MTGTSLDGVDAALVEIDGTRLGMSAVVRRRATGDLGEAARPLRALASGGACSAAEWSTAAEALGQACATTAEVCAGGERVDLLVAHGQTIHHAPPRSVQLFDPAPLHRRLGAPVVFDLRRADLAAGGQGAPITPLADWILFRGDRPRAIVNLGGFINLTLLPAADDSRGMDAIRGMDLCPCNHLLNSASRRALGEPFDRDGSAARRGRPDEAAIREFVARWAPAAADQAPRSLGSGDEDEPWFELVARRVGGDDLCATMTAAVARCLTAALERLGAPEAFIAGGSARNSALMQMLAETGTIVVNDLIAIGVEAEAREAAEMAILGALCVDGVPITLPQVTGVAAPAPLAGTLYPAGAFAAR